MDSDRNVWFHSENLVDRLKEERWKFSMVQDELDRVDFVLQDFRDLQLYPRDVVGFTEKEEVELDKRLERIEKQAGRFRASLEELEKPMLDAILIAQEMLKESPNLDMVANLREDNIRRLQTFIRTKKGLNRLWEEVDALLWTHKLKVGFRKETVEQAPFEEAFFKILMSNIGMVSETFYESFHAYKDRLAERSNLEKWQIMAKVDLSRIMRRFGSDNAEFLHLELKRLSNRFSGKIPIGIINYHLGRSYLQAGRSELAIEAFQLVDGESSMYSASRLGILQALFASQRDSSLVRQYHWMNERELLSDSLISHARYLAVQSAFALGMDSLLEAEALASRPGQAHHGRILFLYAKSLVRKGALADAGSVMKGIVRLPQISSGFRSKVQMSLAHLKFEQGFHENALADYKTLLDASGMQAEALYGMVWSRIKMGDLDAAEFILKKLIDQFPDSPWAVEGFLVLSRRLLVKAERAWVFSQRLEEELDKIQHYSQLLAKRSEQKLFSPEMEARVRKQLEEARKSLSREKPLSPERIGDLYLQSLALCGFVKERYQTGEYSETEFSGDRQRVLQKLRFLEGGGEQESNSVATEEARQKVKSRIFDVELLELELHVRHKNWLRQFLRNTQEKLGNRLVALRADTSTAGEKLSLEKKRMELTDRIWEQQIAKSERILALVERLKGHAKADSVMDWLWFEDGMARYELAEIELSKAWNLFQWMDTIPGRADSPGEPTIRYADYERPWKLLVEEKPESPLAAAALYFLGYSATARGDFDQGVSHFEKLVSRFPMSGYRDQAYIFIGEHHFNQGNLAKASEAYDAVLGNPESKYFDQALYKLAWTYYRESRYKKAISSFTVILDDALKSGERNKRGILKNEALQFAALSIAESDTSEDGGVGQTRRFAQRLGDARLGAHLMHRMAVVYTQQGRLQRAKGALEALLREFPEYERNPEVMMDLAKAYEKDQDFQSSAGIREKVFTDYNRQSKWYESQSEASKSLADSVCEEALRLVAKHYFFEAKQSELQQDGDREKKNSYYMKAANAYERFLSVYENSPNRGVFTYQLAEAYYAMQDFGNASRKYMLASRNGDSEDRLMAAYNAIVAAQELLKIQEDSSD